MVRCAVLLGLAWMMVSAAWSQPPAASPSLEERLNQAEKDVAALNERLNKRFRLMPSAQLWITPDHVLFRTAVPELQGKSLGWTVLHDGRMVLQRSAGNELKFDLFSTVPRKPGGYVVYLSSFVDGSYRAVSNILAFHLDDPAPAEKAKPSPSPSPAPAKTSESRLRQIEERLSEFRRHREQQQALPRRYTLWMDSRRVVYRDVGPEELEDDVQWTIGGAGALGRNARGETAYAHYYQGPGEYTISVASKGLKKISNELTFTLPRPPSYRGKPDADNDGLKE